MVPVSPWVDRLARMRTAVIIMSVFVLFLVTLLLVMTFLASGGIGQMSSSSSLTFIFIGAIWIFILLVPIAGYVYYSRKPRAHELRLSLPVPSIPQYNFDMLQGELQNTSSEALKAIDELFRRNGLRFDRDPKKRVVSYMVSTLYNIETHQMQLDVTVTPPTSTRGNTSTLRRMLVCLTLSPISQQNEMTVKWIEEMFLQEFRTRGWV